MTRLLLSLLLLGSSSTMLLANKTVTKQEINATTKAQKQLKAQMDREKKFAKEQTFHQGKNYDLSYAEVDPDSLDDIAVPEPEYDFDMDDVYD